MINSAPHCALSRGCSAGQLEELEGEARGPGLEVGRHRRVLQSLAVRGVCGADQLPVVEVNPELEWRPVSWGDIVISSVLNTEYGGVSLVLTADGGARRARGQVAEEVSTDALVAHRGGLGGVLRGGGGLRAQLRPGDLHVVRLAGRGAVTRRPAQPSHRRGRARDPHTEGLRELGREAGAAVVLLAPEADVILLNGDY